MSTPALFSALRARHKTPISSLNYVTVQMTGGAGVAP
jgi:hypothetical protein